MVVKFLASEKRVIMNPACSDAILTRVLHHSQQLEVTLHEEFHQIILYFELNITNVGTFM